MVAALGLKRSTSECLRALMSMASTPRAGVSHVSVHAARQGDSGSFALGALERGLLSGEDGPPWQRAVSLSHSASVRRGASVRLLEHACWIHDIQGESTRGSEGGAAGVDGLIIAGARESHVTDHATCTGDSSWFSRPLYSFSSRGLAGT